MMNGDRAQCPHKEKKKNENSQMSPSRMRIVLHFFSRATAFLSFETYLSAPHSTRYFTISTCPRIAAQWSAVLSPMSLPSTSAPCSTRYCTVWKWPLCAARASGVSPIIPRCSMSAPSLIRSYSRVHTRTYIETYMMCQTHTNIHSFIVNSLIQQQQQQLVQDNERKRERERRSHFAAIRPQHEHRTHHIHSL